MVSQLFDIKGATGNAPPVPLEIPTPMGAVQFDALLSDQSLSVLSPAALLPLTNDGHLLIWSRDDFLAECLLCRPVFKLPAGMVVEDCWAALWDVQAKGTLDPIRFTCERAADSVSAKGSPANGECLNAQIWNHGPYTLGIGTEDGPSIYSRAKTNRGAPTRWIEDEGWKDEWDPEALFDFTAGGFSLNFPSLRPTEFCQAHFVVAWAIDDEENLSTWFALDRFPDQILKGAEPIP